MPEVLSYMFAALGGYLLGSIPFAYVVTQMFGLGDIREVGSGNVGATNVLRTGNRYAAALTLIGDVGKGVVAVLIAKQLGEGPALTAAFCAFAGHIFPVWLGFKGGKGFATFLGIVTALFWPITLCVGATWLAVAAIMRISSLSALVAAAMSPIYFLFFGMPTYAIAAAALAALMFVTHRENIRRIINGQEPKIGAKKA